MDNYYAPPLSGRENASAFDLPKCLSGSLIFCGGLFTGVGMSLFLLG
jgi:hypothetical protein